MKMFNFREGTIEELLRSRTNLEKLLQSLDTEKIRSKRWFQRKNFVISKIKLYEMFTLKPAERNRVPFALTFIETVYSDKSHDIYFFPIAFVRENELTDSSFISVRTKEGVFSLIDASFFEPFLRFINECLENQKRIKGEIGSLVFETQAFAIEPSCEPVNTNSTNSHVRLNYTSILKLIRKVVEGINVEYEMGNFLTGKSFPHTPPLEGGISYISEDGISRRIGIKFREMPHETNCFDYCLTHLQKYFDLARQGESSSEKIGEYIKPFLGEVQKLAEVIASMHSTLRKDKDHPRFAPEKITLNDIEKWEKSFMNFSKRSIDDAQKYVLDNPENSNDLERINLSMDLVKRAFEKIRKHVGSLGEKTRIHNDLHLAQILKTKSSFVMIDFEGEPLRTIEERAAKFSPLRDVAILLRSFHYVAFSAYLKEKEKSTGDLKKSALEWIHRVSRHFFRSYIEAVRKLRCSSVPYSNLDIVKKMLALFKLEKAVYELCYELNNRPDWVGIPVAGIQSCLKDLEA